MTVVVAVCRAAVGRSVGRSVDGILLIVARSNNNNNKNNNNDDVAGKQIEKEYVATLQPPPREPGGIPLLLKVSQIVANNGLAGGLVERILLYLFLLCLLSWLACSTVRTYINWTDIRWTLRFAS